MTTENSSPFSDACVRKCEPDQSRSRYGPQEIRVAISDARRNYEDAEAQSSAAPKTAYLLGYLRGLEAALASVKWEEHGLG